jgi:hypothetical protein
MARRNVTEFEKQVIGYLIRNRGLSSYKIGRIMGFTDRTIRNHKDHRYGVRVKSESRPSTKSMVTEKEKQEFNIEDQQTFQDMYAMFVDRQWYNRPRDWIHKHSIHILKSLLILNIKLLFLLLCCH